MKFISPRYCAAPNRQPVAAFLFGSATPSGLEIGTGGYSTFQYWQEWGNRYCEGTTFFFRCSSRAAATFERTPMESLAHIRKILKPTVTELADILGVSRQTVYSWQAGKPIAPNNSLRLEDLANAADVFATEGLTGNSRVLRRAIKDGKNFFQSVLGGDSAVSTAQALIQILRDESQQRQRIENRFAGRRRPTREELDEAGAPMLDEK